MSSRPIEVWGKSYPQLGMALRYYDELDSLPDTAWFTASKKSHQGKIDQIIDAVILVLNTSGAGDCRRELRTLQQAITESLTKQAQYREWQISAPPKASLSFFESMRTSSRESYEQLSAAEAHKVTELRERLAGLREQFRTQLTQIGVQASDDEIDTLLNPVTKEDIVSMAAVVRNIASLTTQLEQLTDESKELPQQTKRYYGMYVLLVYSLDRIHIRFIQEIDQVLLPKLANFEQEACKNIAEAEDLIKGRGPRGELAANIDAGNVTIEACRCMASVLREHRDTIIHENKQVKRMLAVAVNTYKTMSLSSNVAELMNDCQNAFRALRQLHLPPLRTFQNLRLKGELQRLTDRMLKPK